MSKYSLKREFCLFRYKYSFLFKVISDANYMIRDIVARWRGSAHDSRIWRESSIKRSLEHAQLHGGVLLGDAGYANSKVLLTPFRPTAVSTLSSAEQRYNEAHIKTRNVVEKTFGQMKNKFRICFNGLQVDAESARNVVVAIAVLYNISKHSECSLFADDENEDELPPGDEVDADHGAPGALIRSQFINKYFS